MCILTITTRKEAVTTATPTTTTNLSNIEKADYKVGKS